MSDPRLNPNYRGEKCPTCGERLPMLFGDQCNYCNLQELKRLQARVDALEGALRPMAIAHKSDRPYNQITLNDLRVAFDLLAATEQEGEI